MDHKDAIASRAGSVTYTVGSLSLHCLKMGNGKKLVLAFHGYGNDASLFSFLDQEGYTILSFDLPFQGKSDAEPGCCLENQDLVALTRQVMKEYGVSKIGLLGFSLGARVCLCITEQLPEAVGNIVLIAPDGIRHNYFYRFFTGTKPGNFLFRSFVRTGDTYLKLFSLLHRLRLLNHYKYRFALQYIRTDASRKLLYNIWMATRKLNARLSRVKREVAARHIPVHILMGEEDSVIPLRNAKIFKGKNEQIHIHVFQRGHNLLQFEEVKGTVAAWLFRSNHATLRG
ncbi:MAG TPA: alpha/beta hydrolase [Chitinophagaceae bacterium]|nr:alpha/beta hydrolase [Chitinophagaceae bacterium]